VQQGGIKDKADNDVAANREMLWVKQVLKKCPKKKSQPDLKMWISLPKFSQHFYNDSCFFEKVCGQNEPP
jgi:hypothetical protein